MDKGQPIFKIGTDNCTVYERCDVCGIQYNDYQNDYNRNIYFIFAGIGLILMLIGLIAPLNLMLEIVTLSTGAILTIEGLIRNREEKLIVFITLGILISLIVWFSVKKMRGDR